MTLAIVLIAASVLVYIVFPRLKEARAKSDAATRSAHDMALEPRIMTLLLEIRVRHQMDPGEIDPERAVRELWATEEMPSYLSADMSLDTLVATINAIQHVRLEDVLDNIEEAGDRETFSS